MVDNFITISLNDKNEKSTIKISHNNIVIYDGLVFKEKSFEIEKCNENNVLSLEGVTVEDINSLSMFDLGDKKLKQLLKFKDDVLTLTYKFPVFPWLHHTLGFGWIVKSI